MQGIRWLMAVWIISLLVCGIQGQPDRNLTIEEDGQNQIKRLALVIGNSKYPRQPLQNASNDARDIGKALEELGFDVTLKLDATDEEMAEALENWETKLANNEAVFYYAGHGVQIDGINYLLPVNVDVSNKTRLVKTSLETDIVLEKMQYARVKVLILDACRNNPLVKKNKSGRSIATGRGLAEMSINGSGTIIIFATSPGNEALDSGVDSKNGLFTESLLKYIKTPGIDVNRCMMYVTNDVEKNSAGKQIPWKHDSLKMPFYFNTSKVNEPATVEHSPTETVVDVTPEIISEKLEIETKLTLNKQGKHTSYEIQLANRGATGNIKVELYFPIGMLSKTQPKRVKWPVFEIKANEKKKIPYKGIKAISPGEFAVDCLVYEGDKVISQARQTVIFETALFQAEIDAENRRLAEIATAKQRQDELDAKRRQDELDADAKRQAEARRQAEANAEAQRQAEARRQAEANAEAQRQAEARRQAEANAEAQRLATANANTQPVVNANTQPVVNQEIENQRIAFVRELNELTPEIVAAQNDADKTKLLQQGILFFAYIFQFCQYPIENNKYLLDMTTPTWQKCARREQIIYAKLYQLIFAEQRKLELQKTYTVGGVQFSMMLIPPGVYFIGSTQFEPGRDSSEIQTKIIIYEPFYISTTEVSQELWQAVMQNNPSYLQGYGLPVENMTWNSAIQFCNKLCQMTSDTGFRLPAEYEWEYVCRAGTTAPFNFFVHNISSDQINFDGSQFSGSISRGNTIRCGSLNNQNAWGLYDMHGNVAEWCLDAWGKPYTATTVNSSRILLTPFMNNSSSISHVVRGGSWGNYPQDCRSASRYKYDNSYAYVGFRIVKTIKQ